MLTGIFTRWKQLRKGLFLFGIFSFICITGLGPTCTQANVSINKFSLETIGEPVFKKWLILNYYNKKLSGTYESEIINPDFFISSDGRTNPYAEFFTFKNLLTSYLKKRGSQRNSLSIPRPNDVICKQL